MPFTLAHPAVVLPLRRYCPRTLSFPALVVGSLIPDLGYFFSRSGLDEFAHSFLGSFGFGLPMGLLVLSSLYGLRKIAARFIPGLHERVFVPLVPPRSPVWAIAVSLLIGYWTHLLLDSLTHSHAWLVEHVPLLHAEILSVHHRTLRVCHLLWYGCSFFGMAWLFLAFRDWQETRVAGGVRRRLSARLLEAGLVASLLLPIEVVHHMVRGWPGLLVVAAFSLAWVAVVLYRVSRAGK